MPNQHTKEFNSAQKKKNCLFELFLTEVVLGCFNSVPPSPDIYQLHNSVPDINYSLNTALNTNY